MSNPPPAIVGEPSAPQPWLLYPETFSAFLANPTPTIVIAGDSLSTIQGGNAIAESELQFAILSREIQARYPKKTINFVNMAIGGSVETNFVQTGSAIGLTLPTAWNQTSFPPATSTWQQVCASFNSDLLVMSWGMNGTNQFTSLKPNLTAVAGWAKVPGVLLISNKQASKQPQFGFNTPSFQAQYIANSSVWRSCVKTGAAQKYWALSGLPLVSLIDVGRYADMALNGTDPVNQYLVETIGAAATAAAPITGITSFSYALPTTTGGDFCADITFPGQAAAFQAGSGLGIIQLFLDPYGTVLQISPSGSLFRVKLLNGGGVSTTSFITGGTIGTGDVEINYIVKGSGVTVTCNGTTIIRNFPFPRAQSPGYIPTIALTITAGASMNLNTFMDGITQVAVPLISDATAYPAQYPSGNGPQGGGTGKHGSSGFTSLVDYVALGAAVAAFPEDGLSPGQPPSAVTPGASPYAYTAPYRGYVAISGGAVSAITMTRGPTTVPTGILGGMISVNIGDVVNVTYSVVPTINFVPLN